MTQARMHGGHRVAEALAAHGVRCVFTLCGGHISPILVAARERGIRIVDVRDEATAVFAADATARLAGVPGVAAVTAGPGLTNAITALKNAQLAQSPLVLIGGAAPTALQGRGALQDIAQEPLVAPHVKAVRRVRRVRDLEDAVTEAFAIAREGVPGPVFVECPVDLLYDAGSIRQWYAEAAGRGTAVADRALRWWLARHADRMLAGADVPARVAPRAVQAPQATASSLKAAWVALSGAQRPLAVVGSQALVDAPQAAEVADALGRLGVPVYLSGMARGLLGTAHPLQMRHRRREALREADCVLLAGVPCDFRLDYGRHVRRSATLLAANRSRRDATLNRRPAVAMIGDAGTSLRALADLAAGAPLARPDWLASLRARDDARDAEIAGAAPGAGPAVDPLRLLRAIDAAASPQAVFVADGGDFVGTASYVLRPRAPLGWLDPGVFGTLGVGAGFALGAALARPDAEVWLLYGDGACGFSLGEFDTFVRHGVAVIAVVGNDAGWTQIAREQVKLLGDDVGTVLARTDYDAVAASYGAVGMRIERDADVGPVLARAREAARAGRPVLVNARLERSDFREGSISM
jgi:acetolactate synthase-1/2/3 large subunit